MILGSGFSGSLLGWILASQGRRVLIVDRQRHPRFAIGESSTPTADFLLAHLADRWGLSSLAPMACWGTWKERYPNLLCGKKRGFSYYRHPLHGEYRDDAAHSQSLLVAASSDDRWSDTHWVRSVVDAFFVQQAREAGATLWEDASLARAEWDPSSAVWSASIERRESGAELAKTETSLHRIRANWILDASGGGGALSDWVANPPSQTPLRTRTRATFGHFSDVAPFTSAWSADDPFCGDDAAQHHVLDRGWCWMLRFDHGVTSVGLVEPIEPAARLGDPNVHFQRTIARYPSLAELMAGARRVEPSSGLGSIDRLSRRRSRAVGPGWALLPTSYGFIDPLHSSGIAHALSGVARLADALLDLPGRADAKLQRYAQQVEQEIDWLDMLVAGCYRAQPSFAMFQGFAAFYFLAAIHFERQMASDPEHWPQGFLQCQDSGLGNAALSAYERLVDATHGERPEREEEAWCNAVRKSISPWNTVGLLDPKMRNRIPHAAAPKYASIAAGKQVRT